MERTASRFSRPRRVDGLQRNFFTSEISCGGCCCSNRKNPQTYLKNATNLTVLGRIKIHVHSGYVDPTAVWTETPGVIDISCWGTIAIRRHLFSIHSFHSLLILLNITNMPISTCVITQWIFVTYLGMVPDMRQQLTVHFCKPFDLYHKHYDMFCHRHRRQHSPDRLAALQWRPHHLRGNQFYKQYSGVLCIDLRRMCDRWGTSRRCMKLESKNMNCELKFFSYVLYDMFK